MLQVLFGRVFRAENRLALFLNTLWTRVPLHDGNRWLPGTG